MHAGLDRLISYHADFLYSSMDAPRKVMAPTAMGTTEGGEAAGAESAEMYCWDDPVILLRRKSLLA